MAAAKKKNPFAPVREKDDSVSFYVRVTHASPDTVQYKPYQTTIEPFGVTVLLKVNVEAKHVLGVEADTVILTALGWFLVSKQIATGAMTAHVAVVKP